MNEKAFNNLVEGLVDFSNALERAVVNLKRQIKALTKNEPKPQISAPEHTFKYIGQKSKVEGDTP